MTPVRDRGKERIFHKNNLRLQHSSRNDLARLSRMLQEYSSFSVLTVLSHWLEAAFVQKVGQIQKGYSWDHERDHQLILFLQQEVLNVTFLWPTVSQHTNFWDLSWRVSYLASLGVGWVLRICISIKLHVLLF